MGAEIWPILAPVGSGASIREIAGRLNLFELTAVGLVANLYGGGLIVTEHALSTNDSVVVNVTG